MYHKATLPGQLPPLIMIRSGESRTITIDISDLLGQYELAVSSNSDDPRVSECRTRLGKSVEMRVSGDPGPVDTIITVRTVTGERVNTVRAHVKLRMI